MEGGSWTPSTETGGGGKGPGPKNRFFLQLRSLGVLALFFLLLRFGMGWSQWERGVVGDPRDRWEAHRLSPFDTAALRILPGIGPGRALVLRDWARGVWVVRGEKRSSFASRPKGIGERQWRALKRYLDLSDLSEERKGPRKSSRD